MKHYATIIFIFFVFYFRFLPNGTYRYSLDSNGVYGFSCWICDSMSSAIYYDENQASFTVDNVIQTFGGCEADLEDDDEFIYIRDVQSRFLDFMSQPGDFSYAIYPNPVKDYLFLKSTHALKNVTVEIYDILGRSQIFILGNL